MLVALGAGDAHAEKHLRGHRRHLARLGGHLIKETGRLVAQRTFGGEQFARPLIERSVVPHGGADPLVIGEGILVPEREAIDPQQVAPFERPEIGELSPPHQLLNQLRAFIISRVLEKRLGLGGGGQCADQIKMRAPQEGGVVGEVGGMHIQPGQMPVHMAVDEIMHGTRGQCRLGSGPRHDRLKHRHLALEPGHHGGLANAAAERHQPLLIHLGHADVIGMKHRLPCHIRFLAVGVAGNHLERLLGSERQHSPGRLHSQRHHRRPFPLGKGQPATNPIMQHAIFARALLQTHAAAMPHLAGGFAQKQTGLRRRLRNAPAARFLEDGMIIPAGIGAEHGQLESVLPLGLAVTGRAVAAQSAKQRFHVVHEIHRQHRRTPQRAQQSQQNDPTTCHRPHDESSDAGCTPFRSMIFMSFSRVKRLEYPPPEAKSS